MCCPNCSLSVGTSQIIQWTYITLETSDCGCLAKEGCWSWMWTRWNVFKVMSLQETALSWTLEHCVSLKWCWYPATRLHGVITQKTTTCIFTAMHTLNLMCESESFWCKSLQLNANGGEGKEPCWTRLYSKIQTCSHKLWLQFWWDKEVH